MCVPHLNRIVAGKTTLLILVSQYDEGPPVFVERDRTGKSHFKKNLLSGPGM